MKTESAFCTLLYTVYTVSACLQLKITKIQNSLLGGVRRKPFPVHTSYNLTVVVEN